MADILNIGRTALNAAQVGLSVTGHNIANASTPGYSRQQIVQTAALAQNFGYGFLGQGTEVSQVKRNYSDILAKQLNNAETANSANSTYLNNIAQIDNILADSSAGLSPAFQQFFASVQGLASNPGNVANRQAVISSAESLVNRFTDIGSRLEEIRTSVNNQLSTYTEQVTSYASQIGQLNNVISKSLAVDSINPPNDLMDQRDLLISNLNKLIKADIQPQSDGTYNVFIGNGIPLVVGSKSYGLKAVNSAADPTRLEVAYANNITTELDAKSLTGGAIGGLLQFRSNSLDGIQNQLGQIATVFAATFNEQHQAGYDKDGVAGTAFFAIPTPQSYGEVNNSAGATLTASITNASALTASDYRIQYDGSNYNITRLNDNSVQTFSSLPQTVDGVSINGSFTAGDSFLLQPTRNNATGLSVLINNVDKIAASDINGGSANNINALQLAELQTKGTLNNGSISYESAFGQLVSGVGNKTNELKVNSAATQSLLLQTQAAQQSESGVNLDEEAANLLRYQQAYQAAGKVMQIASSLFETLLALGR